MKLIEFNPRKFIDMLTLNDIKLTHIVKRGVDRNYFIPRYKEGTKKLKELPFDYKKSLRENTIRKIAKILVEHGFFTDEELIFTCFESNNFEPLLPSDLL
jgi:hypothetical protein